MNLKYPLLGFLSYEPATGYRLTKKFFKPIRPVRAVVYRYLNLMLEEGLVEANRVEQEKFPAKKIFRITRKGREALNKWLTTFSMNKFAGDGLPGVLWYSGLAEKQATLLVLKKFKQSLLKDYQYYREESQNHLQSENDPLYSEFDHMYQNLVYDYALVRHKLSLSFVEKAIREISNFKENTVKESIDGQTVIPKKMRKRKRQYIDKD